MYADTFISNLMTAVNAKTLYVKGGFGLTLTKKGKDRAINSYPYNARKDRAAKINAMPNNSFGFDCCGLVKAALSGFVADPSKVYGGVIYHKDHTMGEMGVPDVTEKGLLDMCNGVTKCKLVANPTIPVGAFLWMTGHCGVYIGDNKVIEATPAWKDGAQITSYTDRNWMKWGLLPFVEYADNYKPIKIIPPLANPTLRIGSRGVQVNYLQQDLNYAGYDLAEDGIFGAKTYAAVKDFQKKHKLGVDGIYGPITAATMKGVLNAG